MKNSKKITECDLLLRQIKKDKKKKNEIAFMIKLT